MYLNIFTDGGARGNPGPAGIGAVIYKTENQDYFDNQENQITRIHEISEQIGEATNNVAEYTAVAETIKWLTENKKYTHKIKSVNFHIDSRLIVNQLNGMFKVKNNRFREFINSIRISEQIIGKPIYYKCIPRHKNSSADLLVNQALDNIY